METQDRLDNLERAKELINEAMLIEAAVRDTTCQSSADAYIISHLGNWANGYNPHEETIPVLARLLIEDHKMEMDGE